MKSKKRYIVILIILAIYILLMLLIYGKNIFKKDDQELTLIIGDHTIWKYSQKKWQNITNSNTIDALNWKPYIVYIDNKKIGEYYLWNDEERWYIFDKNKNAINNDGDLIAYNSKYDIKVNNYNSTSINNDKYVKDLLKEKNISESSELTVSSEVTFDIDNDGVKETLYFISNAFPLDFVPNKIFSFVFMIKDNNIHELYDSIDDNKENNGCKPYLSAIIDVDNDSTYELAISCAEYSIARPTTMLYKLTEEGFKILISNQ